MVESIKADICIIGAGSLVPPRMKVPPGSLVVGSPARVKRRFRACSRGRSSCAAASS